MKPTAEIDERACRPFSSRRQVSPIRRRVGSPSEVGASAVQIGTSGWMYDSWRGPFYPQQLAKRMWLANYATRFGTVEINSAFYRTPPLGAVEKWRETTPPHFTFAWKASKFITHWKRLGESCENSINLMQTRIRVLGPKVAAVLFQLPPHFAKDTARLEAFLGMLPQRQRQRYAFEFRHATWYKDDVFDLLQRRGVSLCLSDHADAPSPWLATAKHVYVRGQGPHGNYGGSYSTRTLRSWSNRLNVWRGQGRDVFVYFDNDQKGAAPGDAERLVRLIGE